MAGVGGGGDVRPEPRARKEFPGRFDIFLAFPGTTAERCRALLTLKC